LVKNSRPECLSSPSILCRNDHLLPLSDSILWLKRHLCPLSKFKALSLTHSTPLGHSTSNWLGEELYAGMINFRCQICYYMPKWSSSPTFKSDSIPEWSSISTLKIQVFHTFSWIFILCNVNHIYFFFFFFSLKKHTHTHTHTIQLYSCSPKNLLFKYRTLHLVFVILFYYYYYYYFNFFSLRPSWDPPTTNRSIKTLKLVQTIIALFVLKYEG